MSEASTGSSRAARTFKSTLVWALVLGLMAAVGYLLSERNARTFALELRGGELVVMRGRFLPSGATAYLPEDRVFAQAYAPLPAAGEPLAGLDLAVSYSDRDQLDRALFKVLKEMIEIRLGSDEPARLGEAVKLLRRSELLGGVLEEQRAQLKELQARVAFFEGRSRLDDALAALKEAVEKLRIAATSTSSHSTQAGELYDRVAGLADKLARVARQPLTGKLQVAEEAVGAPATPALPAEAPLPAAPASSSAPSPRAPPEPADAGESAAAPQAPPDAPPPASAAQSEGALPPAAAGPAAAGSPDQKR